MSNTVIYLPQAVLKADDFAEQTAYCLTPEQDAISQLTLQQALSTIPEEGRAHIVLAAADVTITQVQLTKKQSRHIQTVLPFLLEESLLSHPEKLWFSYSRPAKGENTYPVAVCDKSGFQRFYEYLSQFEQMLLAGIWVDAQLWSSCAPIVIEHDFAKLFVQSDNQAISLPPDTADETVNALMQGHSFEGEEISIAYSPLSIELMQQLLTATAAGSGVNLLHDELPAKTTTEMEKYWLLWRPAVYFSAAIMVFICLLFVFQTKQYESATRETYQASVQLYQDLFPNSGRPQLLQREFESKLKRFQDPSGEEGKFTQIMKPTGETLRKGDFAKVTPSRFKYDERHQELTLDIDADSFSLIEELQSQLKERGLAVSIGNSRTSDDKVSARIKVKVEA